MSIAAESSSSEVSSTQPVFHRPLNESLYDLSEIEKTFFKKLTCIQDDDELKRHIIAVQEKAYEVYSYHCIQRFAFTKLKISRLPAYPSVQKLRAERPDAILLDIGCCFGNDIRKAVYDGWPVENVIASDLRPEFWNCGHELFRSTPSTFPAAFVSGDAFDSAFISSRPPFSSSSPPTSPRPASLKDVTSLTQLQGYISAIHASSFFHLFDEAKQLELGERLASLLSSQPGSLIFGSHVGRPVMGFRQVTLGKTRHERFCHSPESWAELWNGQIFERGTVDVKADLVEADRPELATQSGEKVYLMSWSVTRL